MQGFSTFGWQHLLWLTVLAVSGAAVLYRGGSRKKDSTEASAPWQGTDVSCIS